MASTRSTTAWRTKCCAMGRGSLLPQQVSRQGDPGEEPHEGWRCTGNGSVRSLALGLHAQVSPHPLKGGLQLPAQHRPFLDPRRVHGQVGAQQTLCGESPVGVPDQYPAQGHGRPARAIPHRGRRDEFHRASGAVAAVHRSGGPGQTGMGRWVISASAGVGLSAEADRSGPSGGAPPVHKCRRPGASG